MISCDVIPRLLAPRSAPDAIPRTTVANATPRAVWVCGSKKIST